MSSFNLISEKELNENIFEMFGEKWALLTAGTLDHYNTMTVAWGGFGVLWNKNVCFLFVRPQRFTYEFTEKYDHFTVSFYNEQQRDALKFCGTRSGRDTDKATETGLVPTTEHTQSVYFDQAYLVVECKKLYACDLNSNDFICKELDQQIYPSKDHHRMYVCEITKCLKRA